MSTLSTPQTAHEISFHNVIMWHSCFFLILFLIRVFGFCEYLELFYFHAFSVWISCTSFPVFPSVSISVKLFCVGVGLTLYLLVSSCFTQLCSIPLFAPCVKIASVKHSLTLQSLDLQIPLSTAEVKSIRNSQIQRIWQEHCNISNTGRHLKTIQKHFGHRKRVGRNWKDEMTITHLRL